MQLTISYLVSPAVTRHAALAMYDEMRKFLALSDDRIQTDFSLYPVLLYPGTAVRKRFAHAIDMDDFFFSRDLGGRLSPWKAGAAPSLAFHRAVQFLPADLSAETTVIQFRQLIDTDLPL